MNAPGGAAVPDSKKRPTVLQRLHGTKNASKKLAQAESSPGSSNPSDALKTPRRRRPQLARQRGLLATAVQHQLDAGLPGRDRSSVRWIRAAWSLRIATTTSRPPSPSDAEEYQAHRAHADHNLPAAQAKGATAATYRLENGSPPHRCRASIVAIRASSQSLKLDGTIKLAPRALAGLPDVSRLWRSARINRRRSQASSKASRRWARRRQGNQAYLRWQLVHSVAGPAGKSFVDEQVLFTRRSRQRRSCRAGSASDNHRRCAG